VTPRGRTFASLAHNLPRLHGLGRQVNRLAVELNRLRCDIHLVLNAKLKRTVGALTNRQNLKPCTSTQDGRERELWAAEILRGQGHEVRLLLPLELLCYAVGV